MTIHKIIIFILVLLIAAMLNGNLLAESTQSFKYVRVSPDEKQYAASLLLENADLDEIIKILNEYTGAEIKVLKPPVKNMKTTLEFHFNERGPARKLVWHGKKATVKTYVTEDDEVDPVEIKIREEDQGKINIKLGKKISVEYTNIRLETLLKRFSELGNLEFKLDDELKKENIRVNLTMKNFSPEEALKALANLENLEIKKLDDNVFLITRKK